MHAPKKESCGREWWLETHKWFYGWEVNKNQERGQVVLAVHSGWGDLKEEGMKMCAGCRCMFLDPSGWPFLILPFFPFWWRMKRYSRGMCVDWSGWGGQYQPFLDFPQCQPSSSFKPFFYVLQQEIKFLTLRKQRNDHRCIFKCSNVQLSKLLPCKSFVGIVGGCAPNKKFSDANHTLASGWWSNKSVKSVVGVHGHCFCHGRHLSPADHRET